MKEFDVAIIGGGLSGGMIAWFLAERRPELDILLLEAQDTLAGNHTWSFHFSDLEANELETIRPLISKSWSEHEVRFPERRRVLNGTYASIRSETFAQRIRERLADLAVRVSTPARSVSDTGVLCEDGTEIQARCVIDARGFSSEDRGEDPGFQKFLGMDLLLKKPHGVDRPLLMDATVPQLDGYRFIYVLPWDERRVLIEDTRYSNQARIDEPAFEAEILRYANERGWEIEDIERRERAALPIPRWKHAPVVSRAALVGVGAGFFHPTTGYSVPDAVRIAAHLSRLPQLTTADARERLRQYALSTASARGFYRLLNRLLLDAAAPDERFRVLQRFYGLPMSVIARFYAGQSPWKDRVRILAGRPPVPVFRAVRAIKLLGRPRSHV